MDHIGKVGLWLLVLGSDEIEGFQIGSRRIDQISTWDCEFWKGRRIRSLSALTRREWTRSARWDCDYLLASPSTVALWSFSCGNGPDQHDGIATYLLGSGRWPPPGRVGMD